MKIDKQYISTTFSKFEKVNEEFVKCTIAVNSYDQIANGTKFRKEAIEKALPTLNYAPVIGYFKSDEGDFSGHGIEYKITDNGFEEVVRTIPFGVVIKDSYRWEMLTKDNGEKEEYVVADCYLWGRYKDAVDVVKDNLCNQSMEVNVQGYDSSTKDYFDITEFTYSALCILGSDVTPAFNLAKIRTSDKFSKEDFKACYSEMTEALDKFLNFEERGGDENMAKKRICSKCETEIEFDKEFNENEEFVCDECSKAEFSKKKTFELSFDEIREKLRSAVKTEDSWCWVVQTFEDYFIYEEEKYNEDYSSKLYKQSYSIEENEVKLFDDKTEVFSRYLTQEEMKKLDGERAEFEKTITDLKSNFVDKETELEGIKADYSSLEAEIKELREYKSNIEFESHKIEVDTALEVYSELETVDGYSELTKDKYSCDLETLIKEIKVFAFDNGITLGKKAKKNFTKESVKIPVVNKEKEIVRNSAWNILDKYVPSK